MRLSSTPPPQTDCDARLYPALRSQLVSLEKEISLTIAELEKTRGLLKSAEHLHEFHMLPDGVSVEELRRKLALQSARLESLCAEHAALEGLIERRAARRWRVAQFVAAGLGTGGIIGAWLQRLIHVS
jgi:hypothetical protein